MHVNLNLICCMIVVFCCILFPHFCGLFRRPLPDRPPPRLPDRPLVPGGKPDLTGNRQNGPGQSLIWGPLNWRTFIVSLSSPKDNIDTQCCCWVVNQPDTGSKNWNIKSDSQWAFQIPRAVRCLIADFKDQKGCLFIYVHSLVDWRFALHVPALNFL